MIRRHPFLFLFVCITFLAAACLLTGPVSIGPLKVCAILFGMDNSLDTPRYIVLESRLPQMLTALLSGCALWPVRLYSVYQAAQVWGWHL